MTQTVKKLYTVEEYFAYEETAEYKSEYYMGEIIPMTGASLNHWRIVTKLISILDSAFSDRDCEVFGNDARVQVSAGQFYTYPDIVAFCGKLEFYKGRRDTITNPSVIIEVLSSSTQAYDKGEKFERYKTLESFQNYVLVDQKQVQVTYYRKLTDGTWQETIYNDLNDTLRLDSVEVEIPLARIYYKVDFSQSE